ncbi:MAG TPA: iron-containing alcohol dehydrogenase [Verrucomicrobiae bacterium]|nr:iron-containing alcohol dehydrogenase [Verrucomicrobiae bacterium]
MNFEFATAGRIIFGPGQIKQLPDLARVYGSSALVVVGKQSDRTDSIRRMLGARGISVTAFSVPHEPTLELVTEGSAQVRLGRCETVIAIGGGSVIDAGKAIAALATNRESPLHYLEVIGNGEPLEAKPLPMIAVPTTAGSGAEVTRNAVLTSTEHKTKVSLRHAWMLPSVALVDPELTFSMPPSVTAATGMDALSQLIEPFVSSKANPMTDAICREGLDIVARSLRVAFHDGAKAQARADMALGSLFGGLALANSGLGAVHGFAAPFGAMFNAPHGAVCAALLAPVMRANIKASPRFEEVARRLSGRSTAKADDGVQWVAEHTKELNIPGLSSYGLREEHFAELIVKAKNASSMRANPVALKDEELAEILHRAL